MRPSFDGAVRLVLHDKPVRAIDIDDERPSVPCFIMPEGMRIAIK